MNNLQVFKNSEFGTVKTVNINNDIYFIAKEIAEILGYGDGNVKSKSLANAVNDHVDEDDKLRLNHSQCVEIFREYQNGDPNFKINSNGMIVINESGLYSLILSSKLPSAKKFKKWVTGEVLPTIRKHGAYMSDEKIAEALSDPDTIIKLAMDLKEERQRRKEAQAKIEADKPKVIFADAVSCSESSILVGELAKLLNQNGFKVGQNRLFELLRQQGFLIKSGSQRNMPTQMAMERGLFEIIERTINSSDGTVRITKTPKVTGKGQVYFINRFIG